MGKPTICLGENKGADQLRGNREAAKLISAFVFATWIVQCLFYLNPKFQASRRLLCLYSPVCVRPVRKPHCWFSHEAAHIILLQILLKVKTKVPFLAATKFGFKSIPQIYAKNWPQFNPPPIFKLNI